MRIDFLTTEQKASYAQFLGEPNQIQLSRYFHLDEADLELIARRRGNQNRLGFALQLTSVRFLGAFVVDPMLIPDNVQKFIALQLSIEDITLLADYAKRTTTKREHTAIIRKTFGYCEFHESTWKFRLSRMLYNRAWINNEKPSIMFDFATDWLVKNKILLPGATTLSRLISEIRERAKKLLYKRLYSIPTIKQKHQLETLFQQVEGLRFTNFEQYRKGSTTISGPAFNVAVDRYIKLKFFDLQNTNFHNIPSSRLKSLARYAGIVSARNLMKMSYEKRIATLVAFVKAYETIALDDALDIFDLHIGNIITKAKQVGQKKRLRSLADLDKSALVLAKFCARALNTNSSNNNLETSVFAEISREQLKKNITIINELARPSENNYFDEMVEQYGRVRQLLPSLLQKISFKAAPAGQAILETLDYLTKFVLSHTQILNNPPLNMVPKNWKRLVFDKEGKINKKAYILCFLEQLQDALRRRDVYVENSDRWSDPRQKLLQNDEWKMYRMQIYRLLNHPIKPSEAISNLKDQLDHTYKKVATHLDPNYVNIDSSGKNVALSITNLDKIEETSSLKHIRELVTALLPKIDLTELILEINVHTGFANEFSHISEANARVPDLSISICAVLLAEACNIGFEPLTKDNIPALTRHRLSWVKQNYLRSETLIAANARLVDYQYTIALAQEWGGGEVASADGMRFVVPVKTINASPNKKYFGNGRGITWYNFISDQYSGFHGIVIPGTLRDSIFVLEGLLEQQTGLRPKEIMTDTAGASNMIFGLFWLLGYQFSPRLADAGEAIFGRIDKKADYGILNDIARGHINTNQIEQHWDDMIRTAGSLKLGTVKASELIRSLLKSDKPSSLAKAIVEVGRINKTLYLLNYIDDIEYRRRILTQLNRGEGRHSLARRICHGKRGEIRKRYREGQEDQLEALGLVTNAVVLWNTIYMQKALEKIQQSVNIKPEDKKRLSPLTHRHINVLGHYSFVLEKQITKGKLRKLNEITNGIINP